MSDPPSLQIVKGVDPILRADVVAGIVDDLLGGEDRTLALDDIQIDPRRGGDEFDDGGDDPDDEGVELSVFDRIMVGLESPPFLTSRRVVVVRSFGALNKDQCTMLAARLADPTPGVFVVLEHSGGKLPGPIDALRKKHKLEVIEPPAEAQALAKGAKAGVVEVELQRRLQAAGVKLHTDARARIVAHLGDDAARVGELVETLARRFPLGSTIRVDDLDPYLGAAGTVDKPFELTSAIETGDVAAALDVLHRLMHSTSAKHAKATHPIQLMGVLVAYYRGLLKLDADWVRTKDDAATALGGSPWAAKYRLDAFRAIGPEGVREAYGLLAQADLDLRGARAIDEGTVMQVLVARLCGIHRRNRRGAPAAAGRRR